MAGEVFELEAMPSLVAAKVTALLGARDLLALSRVSRHARWLVDNDESPGYQWEAMCRAYAPCHYSEWGMSDWKSLFMCVYFEWGKLLGSYVAHSVPYGGLVEIVAEPPQIVAYSIYGRAGDMEVERVPAFVVSWEHASSSSRSEPSVTCLRGRIWGAEHEEHSALILRGSEPSQGRNRDSPDAFELRCSHRCDHDSFEMLHRNPYTEWAPLFLSKVFEAKYPEIERDRVQFTRLPRHLAHPPREASPDSLDGLWKGCYGPHGIEFLHISTAGGQLVATKVTGDPNIWAGKVSFKADLVEGRTGSGSGDLPSVREGYFSAEDAREMREAGGVADRLQGWGQIAGFSYQNPSWTPLEIMVCEGRALLAVCWHELHHVSLFRRLAF